jgi:hypothetical protein
VLIDFRDALSYDGWKDSAKGGWSNLELLSSMDSLAGLDGIKIVDQQLRVVSLPHSNLSGSLPQSFFSLPHLTELHVQGNHIVGRSRGNVGFAACLPNLVCIDIRGNPDLVLQIDPEFLTSRVQNSACSCVLEGPIHPICPRQTLVDIKRECLTVNSGGPITGVEFIAQLQAILHAKYGQPTGDKVERLVQLACARTSWGGDLYLGVRQQLGGRSFTHTHALTPSRVTPDPISISFEEDEITLKMHVSLESFNKIELDQESESSKCVMQVEAWLTVHLDVGLLKDTAESHAKSQETSSVDPEASDQEKEEQEGQQEDAGVGIRRELEVQFLRPVLVVTA